MSMPDGATTGMAGRARKMRRLQRSIGNGRLGRITAADRPRVRNADASLTVTPVLTFAVHDTIDL